MLAESSVETSRRKGAEQGCNTAKRKRQTEGAAGYEDEDGTAAVLLDFLKFFEHVEFELVLEAAKTFGYDLVWLQLLLNISRAESAHMEGCSRNAALRVKGGW